MLDKVFVLITMDVEVPCSVPKASGPSDWAESERAIRGYVDLAADAGFPISFFLHPEAVDRHVDLMEELRQRQGAFVDGLHLHPWKFADGRWPAHFGGLNADEQREIVTEARQQWEAAFGRRPRYFRPGTFSANDNTFDVLASMGFVGGSISAPDRVFTDLYAVWSGAPRDPHRAHRVFRQQVGDMDFANIPLTHDYADPIVSGTRFCYRDLRPDNPGVDYDAMLRRIIEQLRQRDPQTPVIHMDTHNDHDYRDPHDAVRGRYVDLLESIHRVCADENVTAVGSTVDAVCDRVLRAASATPRFVHA